MPDPDDNPLLGPEFEDGDEKENAAPKVFLDDASDPKKIRRKVRQKKLVDENSDAFWKRVLADPVGRHEFWQILDKSQAFGLPIGFAPNGSTSTEATLYKIGQQQLALSLFRKWLLLAPELVYLMLEEHRLDRAGPQRSKAITSNGRPGSDSDPAE